LALQALADESTAPERSWDATLQHISLLRHKQDRLRAAQIEAEHQLLHSVAAAYRANKLDLARMAVIYRDYATVAVSGFQQRWNLAVPIPAKQVPHLDRGKPNGPNGSWFGTYPIGHATCPLPGVCVVYVLFDGAGEPCYVGSTQQFRRRIGAHRMSIGFERWIAYPCADREAAYELEVKLLKENKPYRNKRRGR
jgi:hypothetical protein